MTKVATADNHDPASFRAYFWAYSARELAEELSTIFFVAPREETEGEWLLDIYEEPWLVTGNLPSCIIAKTPEADSLDAAELLGNLESLRGPWKIEILNASGDVVREHSSEAPLGS